MTNQERKKVYTDAYNILLRNSSDTVMCWCLMKALNEVNYHTKDLVRRFPEFAMFRPYRTAIGKWFSGDNEKDERLTVLAFCIAMCE